MLSGIRAIGSSLAGSKRKHSGKPANAPNATNVIGSVDTIAATAHFERVLEQKGPDTPTPAPRGSLPSTQTAGELRTSVSPTVCPATPRLSLPETTPSLTPSSRPIENSQSPSTSPEGVLDTPPRIASAAKPNAALSPRLSSRSLEEAVGQAFTAVATDTTSLTKKPVRPRTSAPALPPEAPTEPDDQAADNEHSSDARKGERENKDSARVVFATELDEPLDTEEDEEDEEEYEVKEIVDHKDEDGVSMVLVRWADSSIQDATWEAEADIQMGAAEALFDYWDSVEGGRGKCHVDDDGLPMYEIFAICGHRQVATPANKKRPVGRPSKRKRRKLIPTLSAKKFELSIQWLGWQEPTWEPEAEIKKSQPKLVSMYWEKVRQCA